MTNNERGFTLIEILITLSLFGIVSLISISIPNRLYHEILLKSTAIEIKSALELSQNLSLNESREYAVEFVDGGFRVKEYIHGGEIIFFKKLHKNISISSESQDRIYYTRDGTSNYGKFVLRNKKGDKIKIDTLIGTGKVRVSDIY